ncbi:MAG: hypothetical protein M1820_005074 [Bogoriella megaspora]|nr:MAG: hypothetical protein M1820_005074 [Bogoriella megaspora]
MTTPGRIVAALASGSQEVTTALANINFDFSLIRLEAPPSFHTLGNVLSRKRKVAAESGLSHITARKLGALFEGTLPNTPCLIEGYGSRASEIAQISEKHEASESIHGILADQAGVDGTSIWAAATSGRSAIAVHLLACMLARMFPGSEATSIWAELIEERKKELANEDLSGSSHISSFLLAQIMISRDQLAEWDNSARAWLRAADEAKSVQQTQLLLIVKNIHVPVSHEKGDLYASVVPAWKSALELMENLFRGVAQCVTPYEGNGALLLALASWHMYPDMDVLGNRKVCQKDPLMPSEAILTVGLECCPAQQDIGVYWSLPLAHYRFYGPPKISTHSLCTDAERISFAQFSQVALGSFLRQWVLEGYDTLDSANIIVRMFDYLTADHEPDKFDADANAFDDDQASDYEWSSEDRDFLKSQPSWLRFLAEAAKALRQCREPQRSMCNRLVGIGMRRAQKLLQDQPSIFGLGSYNDFFAMLKGTELKIQALRRLADRLGMTSTKALIRYRNLDYRIDGVSKVPRYGNKEIHPTGNTRNMTPRSPSFGTQAAQTIRLDDASQEQGNPEWIGSVASLMSDFEVSDLWGKVRNTITLEGVGRAVPDDYFLYASIFPHDRSSAKRSWAGNEIKYGTTKRWGPPSKNGNPPKCEPHEEILGLNELDVTVSDDEHVVLAETEILTFEVGEPTDCALFAQNSSGRLCTTFSDIAWALQSNAFDPAKLARFLSSTGSRKVPADKSNQVKHHLARRALATIAEIYGQFPRATVALKVIELPLLEHRWLSRLLSIHLELDGGSDASQSDTEEPVEDAYLRSKPEMIGLSSFMLDRAETFALLTSFETGSSNPDPSTLSKVMAMSSGDSIFIATQLLADPAEGLAFKTSSVSRIRGNIGKPGVVMLVPPPELQVKSRNSADWTLINHAPFNNELVDSFQGTSLHLAFTEYSRAMNTGTHGVKDAEIYFREAYVQVFFKGQWIGDIDIISSLESGSVYHGCLGQKGSTCMHSAKNIRVFRLASVDNWDEFLDRPTDGIIVRAKNNWMARLAATSLSTQRNDVPVLMKANECICWPCISDFFKLKSSASKYVFIC